MKHIAIIGECMIELRGKSFDIMYQSYGGDTLNTATYLSRVSPSNEIKVSYVSSLGLDKISEEMIKCWESDGIDTSWVVRDERHNPGLYLIQLDEKGERTFLYWRNQSAACYLLSHSDYPKILSCLDSVNMIYLSGISLAILADNDRVQLINQLKILKALGVEIAFDSNFRPALWENIKIARNCYQSLLSIVDIALVTFDDEALLWGDKNEQETIARLSQFNISKIIVKQGPLGATLYEDGMQTFIPTIPVGNVVDTTAAGDSFNAGFLSGYLRGKPLTICCQQGNRLAGVVIQHNGAIIDKIETEHLITEFK